MYIRTFGCIIYIQKSARILSALADVYTLVITTAVKIQTGHQRTCRHSPRPAPGNPDLLSVTIDLFCHF